MTTKTFEQIATEIRRQIYRGFSNVTVNDKTELAVMSTHKVVFNDRSGKIISENPESVADWVKRQYPTVTLTVKEPEATAPAKTS